MTDVPVDPRFTAGLDLLRASTGISQAQVRFHDDESPVIWMAVALWAGGRWEVAAGRHPTEAVLRLCEEVIDGGVCVRCSKPTMFLPDMDDNSLPLDVISCVYSWDPELSTFRRSCDGDDR